MTDRAIVAKSPHQNVRQHERRRRIESAVPRDAVSGFLGRKGVGKTTKLCRDGRLGLNLRFALVGAWLVAVRLGAVPAAPCGRMVVVGADPSRRGSAASGTVRRMKNCRFQIGDCRLPDNAGILFDNLQSAIYNLQ